MGSGRRRLSETSESLLLGVKGPLFKKPFGVERGLLISRSGGGTQLAKVRGAHLGGWIKKSADGLGRRSALVVHIGKNPEFRARRGAA